MLQPLLGNRKYANNGTMKMRSIKRPAPHNDYSFSEFERLDAV